MSNFLHLWSIFLGTVVGLWAGPGGAPIRTFCMGFHVAGFD